MNHAKRVKEERVIMLDMFSGADGSISFVKFMAITDELAKQADEGDGAALNILSNVYYPFARLVRLSMEKKK